MTKYHPLPEIVPRAEEMFGNEFNEKIFRTALSYFDDLDYSEAVIFRPGFEIAGETIRQSLIEIATDARL